MRSRSSIRSEPVAFRNDPVYISGSVGSPGPMFSWNPSVNDTEHAGAGRYTLTATAGGGLAMLGGDGTRIEFQPSPGGWTVDGMTGRRPRKLFRRSGRSLVLAEKSEDVDPAAFWSPAQAGVPAVAGGTVMLADGDLFQVLDRPGRFPGYDVKGWQGGGAYFSTGLNGDTVEVVVHPAGAALLQEDRGEAVLVMFVAAAAGLAAEEAGT